MPESVALALWRQHSSRSLVALQPRPRRLSQQEILALAEQLGPGVFAAERLSLSLSIPSGHADGEHWGPVPV